MAPWSCTPTVWSTSCTTSGTATPSASRGPTPLPAALGTNPRRRDSGATDESDGHQDLERRLPSGAPREQRARPVELRQQEPEAGGGARRGDDRLERRDREHRGLVV